MRFDDRLSTVLRQPARGKAITRIQYRQLLDLLGTSPCDANGPMTDAAYLRLAHISGRIPATDRARMLGEPSLRLRNPRLVAQLAESEPPVAAAAVSAAHLSEEQWLDLIPALPIHARGIVRHRRNFGPEVEALLKRLGVVDRALPPAAAKIQPSADVVELPVEPARAAPAMPTAAAEEIEGIGAIVRRIEQFRRTRQQQDSETAIGGEAPRLPLDDDDRIRARLLDSFDFATDTEGRVVWADPAAAPMAVGLRLAASDAESPAESSRGLVAAFRRRQPARGERVHITGAPAISGDWQADAAPRFDQPGGRFVGYCGRMRRTLASEFAPDAGEAGFESEADRMRQVLHELRTPVNAIQGFAEVIQQQLFGPTPHEYRALAATIASDAARMLAGFEELDRLVKLGSGALELEDGDCDIAVVLAATVAQLEGFNARRGSGFAFEAAEGPQPVAMAPVEAERLVWRLLATLAGAAAPGETLRLKLRPARGEMARITVQLPASLALRDDPALFHATTSVQPPALSAGMFGMGFALRLAAAEANAAGGALERRDGKLRLSLPAIMRADANRQNIPGGRETL